MKTKKILIFISVLFLSLLFSSNIINASDSFTINKDENIIDEIQYTRNRTVEIRLTLSEEDLDLYSGIRIREFPSEEFSTLLEYTWEQDNDQFPKLKYEYQFKSEGDGEKFIGVSLLQKGTTSIYTVKERRKIILDTTPPVITLIGEPNIYVSRNSNYTELGAEATDDYDLSPILTVSDNRINTSKYGSTHKITYTATDFLGNTIIIYRNIYVELAPAKKISSYLIVGIVVSIVAVGVIVYINIMQKNQKKKQKELRYQDKNSVL